LFSQLQQLTANIPTVLSAPQLWSPKILPGIQVWLDGADPAGTGTKPANGAAITTWVDKSGLGYNATGTVAPTYDNGTVRFNGTTQFLNLPDGSIPYGNSSYSIFCVVNFSVGSAPNSGVLGAGAAANNQCLSIRRAENNMHTYWYLRDIKSTGAFTPGTTFLFTTMYQSGSGRTVYISGNPAGSDTTIGRAQPPTGNRIGNTVAGNEFMNGTISEIIVFNINLLEVQRQYVEGYLAWKWGIQGQLPSTHPFAVIRQQQASSAVAQTASAARASSAVAQQASSAVAQRASSAVAQTASSAVAQQVSGASSILSQQILANNNLRVSNFNNLHNNYFEFFTFLLFISSNYTRANSKYIILTFWTINSLFTLFLGPSSCYYFLHLHSNHYCSSKN
jgi:hypothetical protein